MPESTFTIRTLLHPHWRYRVLLSTGQRIFLTEEKLAEVRQDLISRGFKEAFA